MSDKVNTGPNRPLKESEPMNNYEHEYDKKGEYCVRCKRPIYDARTRICDADAL